MSWIVSLEVRSESSYFLVSLFIKYFNASCSVCTVRHSSVKMNVLVDFLIIFLSVILCLTGMLLI